MFLDLTVAHVPPMNVVLAKVVPTASKATDAHPVAPNYHSVQLAQAVVFVSHVHPTNTPSVHLNVYPAPVFFPTVLNAARQLSVLLAPVMHLQWFQMFVLHVLL